ncbi:MAG TPA: ABC transporter permease, partial [Cyclobacteriaceae bacterium]|nr:ABC transporter permease [Cyclobacteriaceae bacterium]
MFSNYLKIAVRSLFKNKAYSFVNITGLALGLACVCIITQYLMKELSYDRFHDGAENIYRISWEDENPQTRTPHPMAQAMVHDFPEVESAVSLTPLHGFGLTRETYSFSNPEKDIRFDERNILAVDTTFFDVFTFPMVYGVGKEVLKNPGGLLISESMAKKYFGDENPVGKQLSVNDEKYLVEVAGVFKDVPEASHFHFDFLVSYVREKSLDDPESEYYTWKDFGHYNYVRLKPGANAKELEAKLPGWIRQYVNISDESFNKLQEKGYGFRLQPITDIHLKSHLNWELETNGYIAYVYMMAAAAILILFIGCVNFINLSTAQSAERAKEIGIRKSLGAFRGQLALQFTGESVLVSLLAAVLAAIILETSLPFFGTITGASFPVNHPSFLSVLIVLALITGVLAGIFPSLFLASAKPGLILKGKLLQSPRGSGFRQAFTTFQFFASMILISSSIVIYSQLRFIQSRELGFDQEETIVLPIKNRRVITPRLDELRNELMKVPGINAVSAASNIPGTTYNQNPVFATANPTVKSAASEALVDYDFFDVMGISFVEGRKFSRENPADKEAFILNETAANSLYPDGAIGKEFSWDFDDNGLVEGTVIGVVKDFHFQSLHQPVRPLLFRLLPYYKFVIVKLNTNDLPATLKGLEATWKKFDNRFDFEFSFLKEDLNKQYSQEQNMGSVLLVFSVIAMTIACFGLLAIAALTF